jgi:hypothetical protein
MERLESMLDICTRALATRDRGNPGDATSLRYDPSKLAPIDKKLVEKPFKYTGDPKKFIHWVERMYNFLQAQDPRWKQLLQSIEQWGPTEFVISDTKNEYITIANTAGVGTLVEDFTTQLHMYLTQYTDGQAASMVLTYGANRSFECWRKFADRGRSRRPEHQHRLHTDIMQPTTATKLIIFRQYHYYMGIQPGILDEY